ncbi:MAG: phage tail tape measure protein [Chloroflexi bacterium RBG_13_54_8]|nr:MAG: phage tail tape measure protein [Chloroflexi bacterium RBG_13_54_8]
MAGEIGKLSVSIGVNLSEFKAGLATASSDMSSFGDKIKANAGSLKAVGAGMLAIGGSIAAAGALSVKTYASMGDEISEMAIRTGFSTEALSELRHAAGLTGTNLGGVEKASRTLSSAIVSAGDGTESYVKAFEKLGLSYEALAGLSPEEQFVAVLSALGDMEDATQQVATASDLFGARMGTSLLPMISDGSDAFNAMRQEAHELGIVFDAEAAAKANEMADSMQKLEASITAVSLVIAEQILPVLMPMIEFITNIISKVRAWFDQNQTLSTILVAIAAVLAIVLIPLGTLLIALPYIISGIAALGTVVGLFGLTLTGALLPLALIVVAIAALIAIGVLLWKNWDTITNAFGVAWEKIKGFFVAGAGFVSNIFKGMINSVVGLFNKMIGLISGRKIIDLPRISIAGVTIFPGYTLNLPTLPTIPSLQYGGIVPGAAGEPVPIVAHGGERYMGVGNPLPAGVGAGGGSINVTISAGAFMGSQAEALEFGYKVRDIISQINRRDGLT